MCLMIGKGQIARKDHIGAKIECTLIRYRCYCKWQTVAVLTYNNSACKTVLLVSWGTLSDDLLSPGLLENLNSWVYFRPIWCIESCGSWPNRLFSSLFRGAVVLGLWASVVASCHLCLHACNRSFFARGQSIDPRAYVISQHVHWPIRPPLPACANQDAWVVITSERPKANSIDTAAWHAWTRRQPLNFVFKAVFPLIHFPALFMRVCPSCHFDMGGHF